ncbi:MAG: acetyl-CoA C-acyltransferase [Gemmatimonadetes bacterium]|nr:acetyl-CoA C-acyltransferase [Gemmatimonadota bacterium]
MFLAGPARTPAGRFCGGLSGTPATRLGAGAIAAALERAGVPGDRVDYVIMGNMLCAGLGQAPARQAAIGAGVPDTVSALTVNKVCASGMWAVVLAAQAIQVGDAEVVVAGGMENMSLAPHLLLNSRTGQRMGDARLLDHMVHDGLWCPFENRLMGASAETIAGLYAITRSDQDEFALRSHRLACRAADDGLFVPEIVPVEAKSARGDGETIRADEGPRRDTSLEKLAALRPAFPPGETVTAGNSSQISDGAAAMVVVSREGARLLCVEPAARIVGYAHAANDPGMLFDAPRIAISRLLERTGERMDDFDLIEINEAFAAQVLANGKGLEWGWDRVNSRGGAIALGHPVGASGARILVTLVHALRQTGGKRGLAAICHGGGGAVAMSVEAV